MNPLFVSPPVVERFSVGQESALLERLTARDVDSDFETLDRADQLLIDSSGLVGGQFRISYFAMMQLCKFLSSGLYRVVRDLEECGDDLSSRVAIAVYNQLVSHGFSEKLSGLRLVVDRGKKQIDGVVGSKYRLLRNLDMFNAIRERMESLAEPAQMCETVIVDRLVMLRFFLPEPAFRHAGSNYHHGYHFVNQEGGLIAMRGANVLIRGKGRLGFLAPTPNCNLVRHIGGDFQERMRKLMGRVLDFRFDKDACLAGIHRLQATTLGMGADQESVDRDVERKLVIRLHNRNLPRGLVTRAVASAILQPHQADAALPASAITKREIASRNMFDFVIAVAREGRSCPVPVREAADQFAHAALFNLCRF